MTTVTITIDATDYDAYISVANATALLRVRPPLFPTWNGLSDDDKGAYVVMATNKIDECDFVGEKTDPNQPLKWPRDGIANTPSDTVPTAITVATAVLAGLLADRNEGESDERDRSIKRVIGTTESVEWFEPHLIPEEIEVLDPEIVAMISAYLVVPENTQATAGSSCAWDRDFFPDTEYLPLTNEERGQII